MNTRPRFDGETYDTEADRDRLSALLDRVRAFMAGGEWRTLADITEACGGTEASVSARLRDLRKARFGGHDIERRRTPTPGLFEYRMRRTWLEAAGNAAATTARPATKLQWKLGADRLHLTSIPEGFTVCRVNIPVNDIPTPFYEAWDVRVKDRPIRLGAFPWQDQAKARAEVEHNQPAKVS